MPDQSSRKAYQATYYQANRERLLARQKAYDAAHSEERSAYRAAWYARNRGRVIADSKRRATAWRQTHPDLELIQQTARSAVRDAIARGELRRPDACEECGKVGPIEAAHHSYAPEDCLSVRWLCRRCHRRWDRNEPKGQRT